MKLTLSPNGIKTLLETDPEIIVSLRKAAAKQVADALSRKEYTTQETFLLEKIQKRINEAVTEGYYGNTLKPSVKKLLTSYIDDQWESILKRKNEDLLVKALKPYIDKAVKEVVSDNIKGLVKDVLFEMFKKEV